MDENGNYAPGTVFCGHCEMPITENPIWYGSYTHSAEGKCPFKGETLGLTAWKALEKIYSMKKQKIFKKQSSD